MNTTLSDGRPRTEGRRPRGPSGTELEEQDTPEKGYADRGTDRILVLDAHKNASVVFSRALAEEDVEITAGGWSRLSPAMLSRQVAGRFVYPSPYQHPDQFAAELRKYLEAHDYLAVVPMGDLSHVLLSKNKQRLEETGTAVGVESWEKFVAANNKRSLAALIEEIPVPGPYTRAPDSVADVAGMKDEFSYPALVKPQYTTVKTDNGTYIESRISEENYIYGPEELEPTYRELVEKYPYFAADLPIIQEVVSGTVMATCGVAEEGKFLGYFQEERLRMFPVEGGPSALRRGIHHPRMAEHAQEIVAALDWTGPIYIEFIHAEDGNCYALEVNGRYWGSVGCAVHGGVNVPLLHYRQLKGITPSAPQGYLLGCKQRRLFYTDIKWLTAQLEAGNVSAVVPFLRSFVDANHDLLAFDDPLPAAGAVLWAVQEILRNEGPTKTLQNRAPDMGAKLSSLLWGTTK